MNSGFRTDLPGLDLAGLARFVEREAPGLLAAPLTGRLLTGGLSNLTYEVTDGAVSCIVRRPPLGHVLPTAHDMAREFRVMSALAVTNVPVPKTYMLCEDSGVVGAPFYLMEKADGISYRSRAQLEPLGPARVQRITERMVDVLADLHQIDPKDVGLDDFGRPSGFLARQLRRWRRQLDDSRSRPITGTDELHSQLALRLPRDQRPGIVHGDFGLDNLLVGEGDEIAAVLDWELSTIGDPLTDLAMLVVYRRLGELAAARAVTDSSLARGFLSPLGILKRYAASSDRDLSDLPVYAGLACFKLAASLEAIHYRHARGQTLGEGFESVGELVEPLLALGLDILRESDVSGG